MELLTLIIGLIALALLAIRFGYDSRDGFHAMAHGGDGSSIGWSDSTYDQELAQEIQEARERRVAHSQVADIQPRQAQDDLDQAA